MPTPIEPWYLLSLIVHREHPGAGRSRRPRCSRSRHDPGRGRAADPGLGASRA